MREVKCVLCFLCGDKIRLGEEFISIEGQCGFHQEYHARCLEDELDRPSQLTEDDIEELGEWEEEDEDYEEDK